MPSLYVYRALLNAPDLIAWAKAQGFTSTVPAKEMHVTVCYSKAPVEWPEPQLAHLRVTTGGERRVAQFGDGAVVLTFEAWELWSRNSEFRALGAQSKHKEFRPHVTITYSGAPADLGSVEPYAGPLVFGPEVFEEITGSFDPTGIVEKHAMADELDGDAVRVTITYAKDGDGDGGGSGPTAGAVHVDVPMGNRKRGAKPKPATADDVAKGDGVTFFKSDDEQRMVWGWASVISKGGVPVVDTQGDVIEPEELVKATTDFMLDVRHGAEMHKRRTGADGRPYFDPADAVATVVHSLPVTKELAQALGIATNREGWIVGYKVHSDSVWDDVKKGRYAAFSIGGQGERVPVAA